MKINGLKIIMSFILFFIFEIGISQENKQINKFWNKVQFGGGLGLGFENNATNVYFAPSTLYNINTNTALGFGVQYSYIKQKGFYSSNLYGASIFGLFNPIQEIQLSAELEQLRGNTSFDKSSLNFNNFWNTALFFGAGYQTNNATIGVRYNVLHNNSNTVYTTALLPFFRVFF